MFKIKLNIKFYIFAQLIVVKNNQTFIFILHLIYAHIGINLSVSMAFFGLFYLHKIVIIV